MTVTFSRSRDIGAMPQTPAPVSVLASANARSEVRGWALLAAGSLAIAGIFALLLAASRVPGSDKVIPWPVAFFGKGLVVHVTFSFVVWFLAVFALLTTFVTHRLAEDGYGDTRLAGLGRIGLLMVALSFPLLLLPAFLNGSQPSLNNYVPLIVHGISEAGLALLFFGVLLPVVRLLANQPWDAGSRQPLALPMTAAALIYVAAVAAIATALVQTAGKAGQGKVYEEIFWGGGHILQFLNSLMMLAAWNVLTRRTVPAAAASWQLMLAAVLLLLTVAAGLSLYAVHGSFAPELRTGFTKLQYALAPPTLIVALTLLAGIGGIWRQTGRLPWSEPAFVALALSAIVFGAGGCLGLFVDGADTRTPAHYHGVIAGVNLAFMGLFFALVLPALGRTPDATPVRLRLQILLFGLGQLVASIGLFVAGGYGAPRKVAGAAQGLADTARIGMYLNGVGALVAIIGGVMFIWTVLAALLPKGERT